MLKCSITIQKVKDVMKKVFPKVTLHNTRHAHNISVSR